jgi:hypothetical protein
MGYLLQAAIYQGFSVMEMNRLLVFYLVLFFPCSGAHSKLLRECPATANWGIERLSASLRLSARDIKSCPKENEARPSHNSCPR